MKPNAPASPPSLWQALQHAAQLRQQARRARAELRAMDDRALQDLGLGRGEVEAVLAGATIKADGAASRPHPARPPAGRLPTDRLPTHGLSVLRAPGL